MKKEKRRVKFHDFRASRTVAHPFNSVKKDAHMSNML